MNFRDDVPMGMRLDIMQSYIRQTDRYIELAESKIVGLQKELVTLRALRQKHQAEFDALVSESGQTHSQEGG